MSKPRILTVFGTRPEAIKMALLAHKIKGTGDFNAKVCITAQHREMLDQVLTVFGVAPDYDLNLMRAGQSLFGVTTQILNSIQPVIEEFAPDLILVHGDTTTTFAASLAAFYQKVPVGHVEAGLRTGNLLSPWPEEANRKLTGVLANLHFAPTESARDNLLAEGVSSDTIVVTGNSVIDSLLYVKEKIEADPVLRESMQRDFSFLNPGQEFILVTAHRRENFGQAFVDICSAIREFAIQHPEVQVVYPVHLNPKVQSPVNEILKGQENIFLIPPQDYLHFIYLMMNCSFTLTDSGGVQEEAPSLGKPVLVMRNTTERPEAVEAGTVRIVGTSFKGILDALNILWSDKIVYKQMSQAMNPYGDGKACERIIREIRARVCA